MAKTSLETAIAQAAQNFASVIVEAVKSASLQELLSIQSGPTPKRRGRKPGPKPKTGKKPSRPKKTAAKKSGRKRGRPKKIATRKITITKKVAPKKKRVAKNYPKCAHPKCGKNRFPRGKGFCGEHWRQWKAGKIKDAASYKKK